MDAQCESSSLYCQGDQICFSGTCSNALPKPLFLDSSDRIMFYDVVKDNQGNSYAAGQFRGSVQFASSSYSESDTRYEPFVAKYSESGEELWFVRGRCSGQNARVRGITLDSERNVVGVGDFRDTLNFDGRSANSRGNWDSFLIKIDTNGNVQWLQTGGGSSSDYGMSVSVDGQDNIYALIYANSNGNSVSWGGKSPQLFGGIDAVVLKYSPSGSVEWAKGYGGSSNELTYYGSLSVDSQDNVVFSLRSSSSSLKLGSQTYNVGGSSDGFIVKLDTSGNVKWVLHAKSASSKTITTYGVETDRHDNVYSLLRTNGQFSIGDQTFGDLEITRYETVLIKLDSEGRFQWGRRGYSPDSHVYGWDLSVLSTDDVVVNGYYYDSDTHWESYKFPRFAGSVDVFAVKVSSEGNTQWVKTWGGSAQEYSYGMDVDQHDNLWMSGYTRGSFNVNGTSLSTNNWAAWVIPVGPK